jgi:hypothetical protein
MAEKYEVRIALNIDKVQSEGEDEQFFDTDVAYHSLPYEGVVAIQAALLGALEKMSDLGFRYAEGKGVDPQVVKNIKDVLGKNK